MMQYFLVVASLMHPDVTQVQQAVTQRAEHLHTEVSQERAERIAVAVMEAAEEHQVPEALILAVIEVESAYKPSVVSAANCHGLMQLNPPTANEVARDLRLKGLVLHKIEHNIRVGTAYLRFLFDKLGRWDYALTAYNMGPGRFRRFKRVTDYARKALRKQAEIGTLIGAL